MYSETNQGRNTSNLKNSLTANLGAITLTEAAIFSILEMTSVSPQSNQLWQFQVLLDIIPENVSAYLLHKRYVKSLG